MPSPNNNHPLEQNLLAVVGDSSWRDVLYAIKLHFRVGKVAVIGRWLLWQFHCTSKGNSPDMEPFASLLSGYS